MKKQGYDKFLFFQMSKLQQRFWGVCFIVGFCLETRCSENRTLPFPNNQWANWHENFAKYKVARAHMKGSQQVSRCVSEWDITRNRSQLCSGESQVQSRKVGWPWAVEYPWGWGPWQGKRDQRLFKTRMPSAKTWEGFSLVYLGSAGQQ